MFCICFSAYVLAHGPTVVVVRSEPRRHLGKAFRVAAVRHDGGGAHRTDALSTVSSESSKCDFERRFKLIILSKLNLAY